MRLTPLPLRGLFLLASALTPAISYAADWTGKPGWVADLGANVKEDGPLISLRKGMILANQVFGDMSLRFEFRLPDERSEARVIVHTLIKSGDDFQPFRIGYAVSLANGPTTGRVVSLGSLMQEQEFRPISPRATSSDFHTCEVLAKHGSLQVFIDGQLVSAVAGRAQFAGYIGFEATKGRGVEIRNAQLTRLVSYREPFASEVRQVGQKGVTTPRVIKQERPFYTVAAMREKVMGNVMLSAVLDEKGSVTDVKVVKSLHPDLDESAIATLRKWQFAPATLDGTPVPVLISVNLSFTLQ